MVQTENHPNVHDHGIAYDGILLSNETESIMNTCGLRKGGERGKKGKREKNEEEKKERSQTKESSLHDFIYIKV